MNISRKNKLDCLSKKNSILDQEINIDYYYFPLSNYDKSVK